MEDIEGLVERAQNGDKDAYGKIYKQYYVRIYRYCRINLKNSIAADDVCQEVFIRAWMALPNFSSKKGTFQAYLFKIARNLIIDLSRKKKELPLKEAENIISDEDLIEDLERKYEIERVRKAFEKLKERDRQIIYLRYFEELSHREVAKILGTGEGALRVKTIRLLQKLKKLIRI